MSTKIEILNLALHKIGTERINSLDDENKRAKVLLDVYDITRKSVLEAHPWNFGIRRAELTPEVDAPAFEYKYKLRVPNDCLRVFEERNNNQFIREGQFLLSNCEKLQIKYIADIVNESEFSDTFAEALALKLGATCAYTMTQNEQLKGMLLQEFHKLIAESRSYSSQESNDYQEAIIPSFIASRF